MSMSYDAALQLIIPAGGTTAEGITPVLLRIATHLGYMYAHIDDSPITPDSSPDHTAARLASDTADITAMQTHARTLTLGAPTVGRATNDMLAAIYAIIQTIGDGWPDDDDTARKARLTDAANRLATVAAQLDTDMAGIFSRAGSHV